MAVYEVKIRKDRPGSNGQRYSESQTLTVASPSTFALLKAIDEIGDTYFPGEAWRVMSIVELPEVQTAKES